MPDFRSNEDGYNSTGNYRGYVATWEIKDGILFLVGIKSWIAHNSLNALEVLNKQKEGLTRREALELKKADLKDLFGGKYQNGRIKADWFSAELRRTSSHSSPAYRLTVSTSCPPMKRLSFNARPEATISFPFFSE